MIPFKDFKLSDGDKENFIFCSVQILFYRSNWSIYKSRKVYLYKNCSIEQEIENYGKLDFEEEDLGHQNVQEWNLKCGSLMHQRSR